MLGEGPVLPGQQSLGVRSETIYLPHVGGGGAQYDCGLSSMAWQFAYAWVRDGRQERVGAVCDELLVQAAEIRVATMMEEDRFAHYSLDGTWANDVVRQVGYGLPAWYPAGANNVESIAAGIQGAQELVDLFYGSTAHRPHVFGTLPMYRAQGKYGVAYGERRDGSLMYSTYWVLITAP